MNNFHGVGVTVYVVKKYILKNPVNFTVGSTVVLLMKSGRFKIQSGETSQELEASDLLIFPRKSDCTEIEAGEKLQFFLIRFSSGKDRSTYLNRHTDPFLYLTGKQAVKISLEESDYLVLSLICRLLNAQVKNVLPTDFEMELRRISSNLLVFELKLIYAKYCTSAGLHISSAEKLAMQFLTVLSIHCRKHHTVKFYSGVLYVTSIYLNRVVKEVTGKSAKKMITQAVLAEALHLLEDSSYTLAEIAEELEFSSLSAFDIFFKKSMYCTPSQYRLNAALRFKSR